MADKSFLSAVITFKYQTLAFVLFCSVRWRSTAISKSARERKLNQPALHITTVDGWMKALLPQEQFAMHKMPAATIWPLYHRILSDVRETCPKTYAGRGNSLNHPLTSIHYTVSKPKQTFAKKATYWQYLSFRSSLKMPHFSPFNTINKISLTKFDVISLCCLCFSAFWCIVCFSGPWSCSLQTKFPVSNNKVFNWIQLRYMGSCIWLTSDPIR